MKYVNKARLSLVGSVIIFFSSLLTAINLEKLKFEKLHVQNNLDKPIKVIIFFEKVCDQCPQVHGEHQVTYILLPEEKKLIQAHSCVIKDVRSYQKMELSLEASTGSIPLCVINSRSDSAFFTSKVSNFLDTQEYDWYVRRHRPAMPFNFDYKDFFAKLEKNYRDKMVAAANSGPLVTRRSSFKIPPTIHIIWFGVKNPVPDLFLKLHHEWRSKHRNWDYVIWNEERIKQRFPEGLFNQKIYDEAAQQLDYATMSKVVRYEILYKFGGLFVEPNLKCYESFEPLHAQFDFFAGVDSLKAFGVISNSVIGARQNHPILKACMEYIKKSDGPLPGEQFKGGNWTMRHLGNMPLTYGTYHKFGQENNRDIIFPRTFFDCNKVRNRFFHYEASVHEQAYVTNRLKSETFCSRAAYSVLKNRQDHEPNPTCFEPSVFDDASALEFVSTNYPAQEKKMVFIVASYNNAVWYERNLCSIMRQQYSNYRVIYVDDASPDKTGELVEQFIKKHNLQDTFTLIKNDKHEGGAAANFCKAAALCHDDEIMVHLDGDDWLPHEYVLSVLNKVYHDPEVWMTYGQCQYHPRLKPGKSEPFPFDIIEKNRFRKYPNWVCHHLRTNYTWLFKLIKVEDLQHEGKFILACWDHALMYPMLEMAGHRGKFLPYLLYVHNGATPLNIGKDKAKKAIQKFFAHYTRHQPIYPRLTRSPL